MHVLGYVGAALAGGVVGCALLVWRLQPGLAALVGLWDRAAADRDAAWAALDDAGLPRPLPTVVRS